MFHYEKMFEPYTKDGATLEGSIAWLKKSTGASDKIVDQAIADTMNKLSGGEIFSLPCPCGCGMKNVHTPINHYMLSKAYDLKSQADKTVIDFIKTQQQTLLESQLKQLSNFDKEYAKMRNGTFWNRLKKFVGARYTTWENEK